MTEPAPRTLGLEAMKAIAHPIRVRIFTELTSYGPATASTLAARLGESSGSTSYHLRQLERFGLVREDPERGNGRDRWWERVRGRVDLGTEMFDGEPGAREAGDIVSQELIAAENGRFADYWASRDELPVEWLRATQTGSSAVQVTAAELEALGEEIWAVVSRYWDRTPPEGARRVDLQFRGFPVVDKEGSG